MKLKQQLRAIALASTMVFGASMHNASHAFVLPVIDAANLAANSITSVEQALNTAQAYISAYNDVLQTWNETTTFDIASVFLGTQEKEALLAFIRTGSNVLGALRKTQDVYEQMQRTYSISKFNRWEDFLKDFQTRKDRGDSMAKNLYQAALVAEDELAKAHEQHMKIVNEMPMIHGVTEASKATAQSVGVLIQQNQGLLQLMSQQTRVQGEELQRQYEERAHQERAAAELLDTHNEAVRRDKALLGGN